MTNKSKLYDDLYRSKVFNVITMILIVLLPFMWSGLSFLLCGISLMILYKKNKERNSKARFVNLAIGIIFFLMGVSLLIGFVWNVLI